MIVRAGSFIKSALTTFDLIFILDYVKNGGRGDGGESNYTGNNSKVCLISLSLLPTCVLFGFNASGLALWHEMAVGFYFAQDPAHLHRLLKATQ